MLINYKTCSNCNKNFSKPYFDEYVWKLLIKAKTHYYCCYTCFREAEKELILANSESHKTNNKCVSLRNVETGEMFYFESKCEASRYIGRNNMYIRDRLKTKDKTAIDLLNNITYKIII